MRARRPDSPLLRSGLLDRAHGTTAGQAGDPTRGSRRRRARPREPRRARGCGRRDRARHAGRGPVPCARAGLADGARGGSPHRPNAPRARSPVSTIPHGGSDCARCSRSAPSTTWRSAASRIFVTRREGEREQAALFVIEGGRRCRRSRWSTRCPSANARRSTGSTPRPMAASSRSACRTAATSAPSCASSTSTRRRCCRTASRTPSGRR